MRIPIYQVDAFAEAAFGGNPAAVCPLAEWLPEETLQSIALENNLSETAFLCSPGDEIELRWFTPSVEVDLCGHATLAAGHVLLNILRPDEERIRFSTRSGVLEVARREGLLELDFPSHPGKPQPVSKELTAALGAEPAEVLRADHYDLAVFDSEEEVRSLNPSMEALRNHDRVGVIASAAGREVDFVSRFFAPAVGVPEDPVTGSAHCTLTPYWSERLNKQSLHARQISSRGGELFCELRGERVAIAGHTRLYLEGQIIL